MLNVLVGIPLRQSFIVIGIIIGIIIGITRYCVPVYQVSKSGTLTQPSYRHKQVLLPEVICCSCKCVLTLEWYCVPVYIPSLIVRNANTAKL